MIIISHSKWLFHSVRLSYTTQMTYDAVRDHLCTHPANEKRRYNVTLSLIGWAHTQNDPFAMCVTSDPSATW